MENIIYLTQPLENESNFGQDGYADKIEKQIRASKNGSSLNVNIDCVGGSVYAGFRLSRALSEHVGETKAIVTGVAASMAGLMLAFFDYVEGDINSEFMLHKAHVPNKTMSELTPEERQSIESFNKKAYDKLLSKGIKAELLHDIFLGDTTKDFYFTAKEAKAIGLINEVTEVTRKDGIPTVHKLAAQIKQNAKIKYESYKLNQMNLFGKKKATVTRAAVLKDERVIVFTSASEKVAKGDKLALLGSNDSLKGEIVLEDGLIVKVNEENIVESVQEVSDETPEEMAVMMGEVVEAISAIMARLDAIEESISSEEEAPTEEEIAAKLKAEEEEEEAAKEAKLSAEEAEEEIEAKKAEMLVLSNKLTEMKAAIKDNTIASTFKLPKKEAKQEKLKEAKLDAASERAIALREVISNTQKDKK